MSPFLNIHTHTPLGEKEETVPSFGVHPWFIGDSLAAQLAQVERDIEQALAAGHRSEVASPVSRSPLFIGECGLDRICTTPYDLQLAAFEAQILLSETHRLPLVLHCVRALDDVLRLKRGTVQPWIFHGFRGKPQQLRQLLSHGFFVSFGFRHQAESLRLCPAERMFLETDEERHPITLLYDTAACLRGTTSAALNVQLHENLATLFAW